MVLLILKKDIKKYGGFMEELDIKLENFIPFDKRELFLYLKDKIEDFKTKGKFEKFYNLVESMYHYQFFKKLEDIKKRYLNFDPDLNIVTINKISEKEKKEDMDNIIKEIKELLKAGNYIEIKNEDLQKAFKEKSPWGLNLKIDLEEFEYCLLFYKGEFKDFRRKKNLFFYKEYNFSVYSRVVFVFKLKEKKCFKKR